jgi:hypothetical protein
VSTTDLQKRQRPPVKGDKRMNRADHAEQPLLGNAAPQDALAEIKAAQATVGAAVVIAMAKVPFAATLALPWLAFIRDGTGAPR